MTNLFDTVSKGFLYRDVSFFFASFVFLVLSYIYEHELKFFSIGYLFYFLVMFLAHLWVPYKYPEDPYLQSLTETKPGDHFDIYFFVFLLFSGLVFIYIVCRGKRTVTLNEKPLFLYNPNIIPKIFYSFLAILPYWIISDNEVVKFIPVFFTSYFIILYINIPNIRKNKYVILGVALSI